MTDLRGDIAKAYDAKRTKASVGYSPGHPTGDHCGVCAHYAAHSCELVAGQIDPAYWCKLFKARSRMAVG